MDGTILSLRGVTKRYPGVTALSDVSIDIAEGEVHAIIGENGAGKSTLIKMISGAAQPDSGSIAVAGRAVERMTPQASLAAGIAVIYQEFSQFDSLSVAENLFLGERMGGLLVDHRAMRERAAELLGRFEVDIDPRTPVARLTPAQRQIVEIAKAIHREARLVIMDEPTAPLTLHEVEKLFEVIRELKSRGIAVIYISHRLEEVFAVCDRVSVLRDGRYIRTLAVDATSRSELIGLMVGREFDGNYPRPVGEPGKIALEVRGVSGRGVSGVSFVARRGEILGVSGLVGAGRTELMRLIYGAEKLEAGEILVDGVTVDIRSPADALRLGIGLIPEDRKRHGAFLGRSITWNIAIASLRRISRLGMVRKDRELDQARTFSEKLKIKAPSIQQKVSNLSGGNQQKVVLAKTLAAETRIIIFDEPTRGIDVGAREEIYRLMCELADNGAAIIMVSSDMEELLGVSDRLIVMADGRLVGEMDRSCFNPHRVLELAASGKTTEVSA